MPPRAGEAAPGECAHSGGILFSDSHQVTEELRNLRELVHKNKKETEIRKGETHLYNKLRDKVNGLFCRPCSFIQLQKLSCKVGSASWWPQHIY